MASMKFCLNNPKAKCERTNDLCVCKSRCWCENCFSICFCFVMYQDDASGSDSVFVAHSDYGFFVHALTALLPGMQSGCDIGDDRKSHFLFQSTWKPSSISDLVVWPIGFISSNIIKIVSFSVGAALLLSVTEKIECKFRIERCWFICVAKKEKKYGHLLALCLLCCAKQMANDRIHITMCVRSSFWNAFCMRILTMSHRNRPFSAIDK